eukprot:4963480-Prymnesium_polylepis.1
MAVGVHGMAVGVHAQRSRSSCSRQAHLLPGSLWALHIALTRSSLISTRDGHVQDAIKVALVSSASMSQWSPRVGLSAREMGVKGVALIRGLKAAARDIRPSAERCGGAQFTNESNC